MIAALPFPLLLILATLAGTGAGWLHFRSLASWSARLVEGAPVARTMALGVLRFAVTIGVLYLASLAGAWPLLAAAAGVALGRWLVLRQARRPG